MLRTARFIGIAALVVLATSAYTLAQAPQLRITAVPSPSGNSLTLTVTNLYSAAAITWLVPVKFSIPSRAPDGSCGLGAEPDGSCDNTGYEDVEAVMDPTSKDILLPGQTRSYSIGTGGFSAATGRVIAASNRGVIYADGATAGEPGIIRRMLSRRQFFLDAAVRDEAILTRALYDPSATGTQLHERFTELWKASGAQLNTPTAPEEAGPFSVVGRPETGWVDEPTLRLSSALADEPSGAVLRARIQSLISTLQTQIKLLRESKPALGDRPPDPQPNAVPTSPPRS